MGLTESPGLEEEDDDDSEDDTDLTVTDNKVQKKNLEIAFDYLFLIYYHSLVVLYI